MDEEELDGWYDSEKEKLTEEYQLKLKKAEEKQREEKRIQKIKEKEAKEKEKQENKQETKTKVKYLEEKKEPEKKPKIDFHETLKKEFLKKMKKLHKDYDFKSKNLVDKNLKKHFLASLYIALMDS